MSKHSTRTDPAYPVDTQGDAQVTKRPDERRVPLLSGWQRSLLETAAKSFSSPRFGAVDVTLAKAITTALDEIAEHRRLNRSRVARARKRPLRVG